MGGRSLAARVLKFAARVSLRLRGTYPREERQKGMTLDENRLGLSFWA